MLPAKSNAELPSTKLGWKKLAGQEFGHLLFVQLGKYWISEPALFGAQE
jgi:hypothetical protein